MMLLKLVRDDTSFDIMGWARIPTVLSLIAMIGSVVAFFAFGLNYGIDFRGGTTFRTEATQSVDVGAYRAAVGSLGLGEVSVSEIFDPSFGADRHVAMVRIAAQENFEAVSPETIANVQAALQAADPTLRIISVDSVGPKVSGELVVQAVLAVVASLVGIMLYVWFRFEWQFGLAAVVGLFHDVVLTVGLLAVLQIRFDLTIIAALLTIVGYSINDKVVVFDRLRENLIKFRKRDLTEVMNLSLNETLSRTVLTGITTLLALAALFLLGGDVIRGFVFCMLWGIVVGTYSSIYISNVAVLRLGVSANFGQKPEASEKAGTQFTTK